jgi:hypothetical protein
MWCVVLKGACHVGLGFVMTSGCRCVWRCVVHARDGLRVQVCVLWWVHVYVVAGGRVQVGVVAGGLRCVLWLAGAGGFDSGCSSAVKVAGVCDGGFMHVCACVCVHVFVHVCLCMCVIFTSSHLVHHEQQNRLHLSYIIWIYAYNFTFNTHGSIDLAQHHPARRMK